MRFVIQDEIWAGLLFPPVYKMKSAPRKYTDEERTFCMAVN